MSQECDHKTISITSKTWVNENLNENFPTKSTEEMDNVSYCFIKVNSSTMLQTKQIKCKNAETCIKSPLKVWKS